MKNISVDQRHSAYLRYTRKTNLLLPIKGSLNSAPKKAAKDDKKGAMNLLAPPKPVALDSNGDDDAVRAFRAKFIKTSTAKNEDQELNETQEEDGNNNDDENGDYTHSAIIHKPFNEVIRNVCCLRCGSWGHYSGDRECPLKDHNPLDQERQAREDPMARASFSDSMETIKMDMKLLTFSETEKETLSDLCGVNLVSNYSNMLILLLLSLLLL